MLVALGSEIISRSSRIKEETALAVLYTLAFSAGIVLLSFSHVQVELEHYLFGNILGLSNSDLWITYCHQPHHPPGARRPCNVRSW